MRIDEVHKIFGKFPQMPQNLPSGNKINNKLLMGGLILLAGISIIFICKYWKHKKDLEK